MENWEKFTCKKVDMGGGHQVTYVEVRDGSSWIDGPSDHLKKLIRSNSVPHPCNKECREWRNDRTRDECYNVRPNGQRCLSVEYTDKTFVAPEKMSGVCHATSGRFQVLTSEECQDQQKHVPPPRNLFIFLHGNPMRIRLRLFARMFEG
jgi:hypothetical protein